MTPPNPRHSSPSSPSHHHISRLQLLVLASLCCLICTLGYMVHKIRRPSSGACLWSFCHCCFIGHSLQLLVVAFLCCLIRTLGYMVHKIRSRPSGVCVLFVCLLSVAQYPCKRAVLLLFAARYTLLHNQADRSYPHALSLHLPLSIMSTNTARSSLHTPAQPGSQSTHTCTHSPPDTRCPRAANSWFAYGFD